MSEQDQVCYTFEGAVERAIQMETESFRHYLDSMRRVKDRAAREILKDAALDELEHKHQLEKALLEGEMNDAPGMARPVPTMNLEYVLAKKELSPESDAREAMAYAIHLENGAIDFYRRMSQGCEGAPMAVLFQRMLADETKHLQVLEDLYERHFMPEN
ncbi:MAG TPA: ferritin family protein [Verrucomicrobiae bacterium]|nr:ferritin family protein [Verrucomicrobiae bacterium]